MRTASILSLVAMGLELAGCDNKQPREQLTDAIPVLPETEGSRQLSETIKFLNDGSYSSSIRFASARPLTADELSRASKFNTKDYTTDENTKNHCSAGSNLPAGNGQVKYSATYQLEGKYAVGLNDGNGENLYLLFDSVGPAIYDEEAEKNPPLYSAQFRFCKTIHCDSGVITTEQLRPSTMTRYFPDEIIYADVTQDGIKDVVFMWETGSLIFQGVKS